MTFRTAATRLVAHRSLIAVLILGIGAVSCDRPAELLAPPVGVFNALAAPELDPGINASDSHAVADISVQTTLTVTSDSAIIDPATGDTALTVTATPPADTVQVQIGFTSAGQVVQTTHFQPDDPEMQEADDPVTTRIVGGVAADYNSAGQIIAESAEEVADGPSPLTQLPVDSSGVTLDGMVLPPNYDPSIPVVDTSSAPAGGSCTTGNCQLQSGFRTAGAGSSRTFVDRKSATELVIVTMIDEMDIVETMSARGASGASASGGSVRRQGRLTRTFDRRGERWMLRETVAEEDIVDGRQSRKQRQTIRVHRLRYHENRERDDQRRQKMREARAQAAEGMSGQLTSRAPLMTRVAGQPAVARNGQFAAMTQPTLEEGAKPYCHPDSMATRYTDRSRRGLGQNVQFQHGIWANACTWNRMLPWMKEDFRWGQ